VGQEVGDEPAEEAAGDLSDHVGDAERARELASVPAEHETESDGRIEV